MRRAAVKAPSLVSAAFDAKHVSLRWADGLQRKFHPLWLRDNCPSRRHPGTRQRLFSAADISLELSVETLETDDDALHVQWAPTHTSSFCASWLRDHGTDPEWMPADGAVTRSSSSTPPAAVEAAAAAARGLPPPSLYSVELDELRQGGDEARWRWLRALSADGATLVRGVPEMVSMDHEAGGASSGDVPPPTDGVRLVAELIGPLQPNIYGDIFDVVSKGDAAENIAYTSEALGPHMDLCYYESPPGLQLLHCLQYDADVAGGESLLIDGFAVAEAVRAAAPAAFATLSKVPATFLKDHSRRAKPVLLSYQRPHLAVDRRGERLTGFFWSPPFEGPVCGLTLDEVGSYYGAYRVLHAAIAAAPRWEQQLQPGEMLVFNNRRMLHGRASFHATAGGGRHLRGCYVNIDEYANALNLLRRAHEPDEVGTAIGNQDWATGVIELPREP